MKKKNKKSLLKGIKFLVNKKKAESENMVINNIKSKTEKQRLVEYKNRY